MQPTLLCHKAVSLALRALTAGYILVAAMGPATAASPAVAQVRFVGPTGMQVWVQRLDRRFAQTADITVPGRLNLRQGQIYRLKLASIPGRSGLTLYPTLQVGAGDARGAAFLSASAIHLELTREDFDQVASGEMLTKTVYLSGAGYHASAGTVLAVLRMGDIDLEPGPHGR
jgi:hypothetical protein